MIRYLFWFICLSFGLGQLVRIEWSGYAVYPQDLLATIFVAVSFVKYKFDWRNLGAYKYWYLLLGWWLVLNLISSLIAGEFFVTAISYWLRLFVYVSFGYYVRNLSPNILSRGLKIWGSFVLVLALTQFILMPDVRWLSVFGWDDHLGRLVGSYFDPNYTGLALILYGLFAIGYSNKRLALLSFFTSIFTYARGVWLVLILNLIRLVKTKQLLLIIGLLVLITIFTQEYGRGAGLDLLRTFSIQTRIEHSMSLFKLFDHQIWLGLGYNMLPEYLSQSDNYHPSGADISYLNILLTGGLVGLGLFGLWLKQLWHLSNLLWWRQTVLSVALHAMFNNTWLFIPVLVWVLISFTLVETNSRGSN